jgi:DNA-binding GntR family transcriptional regulator
MATKKTPDEYGLLRAMILKGDVMPNERLVEADYAERLGTNRANIRRAFARLEQDGLVVSEPFKGTHVRKLTEAEAIEIFEVRGALETLLIAYTAARVTDADKANLKSLVKKMKATLQKGDPLAVGRASRAVRLEMWRISGHKTGERLLENLNSQLVRVWFQGIMMPGRPEAIATEIENVVEAVCSGSVDKSVKAMRRYHDMAIANLKKAISQRGV